MYSEKFACEGFSDVNLPGSSRNHDIQALHTIHFHSSDVTESLQYCTFSKQVCYVINIQQLTGWAVTAVFGPRLH